MEFPGDRPLLRIGELSRRLGGQRPCAPGLGESLRPAAAGALARRLPAVLRGGPVADPPDAGLSRRWAVRGRGGTRRAQQRREYPSRPARRAAPRRACGERAVRRVPAGSGRFRRAGRAGPCRTGCSPICPCRPSCGMSCCPTSLTSASAGSAGQPAWPWSISPAISSAAGSRGWPVAGGAGTARRPCSPAPPELHDTALTVFGIVLHSNGWRIGYLGASTQVEELERAAGSSRPDLVVPAVTVSETLEPLRPELASLARSSP
jgi:hypothetical protein